MAIFPCDMCHKRYAGKGNTIYIGWLGGSFTEREKLNLCPNHAEGVMQWIRGSFTLIERGGVMQTDDAEIGRTCETCGLEPTAQTWFANTYLRSDDPEVYALGVCKKCAGKLSQDMPRAA